MGISMGTKWSKAGSSSTGEKRMACTIQRSKKENGESNPSGNGHFHSRTEWRNQYSKRVEKQNICKTLNTRMVFDKRNYKNVGAGLGWMNQTKFFLRNKKLFNSDHPQDRNQKFSFFFSLS